MIIRKIKRLEVYYTDKRRQKDGWHGSFLLVLIIFIPLIDVRSNMTERTRGNGVWLCLNIHLQIESLDAMWPAEQATTRTKRPHHVALVHRAS